MKILGFKGDDSRGIEIKTILERLGGYDVSGLSFTYEDIIYYIKPNNTKIGCNYISSINKDDFVIFTIDEFKEKFIFNVGDLVRLGEYGKIDTVTKVKWDDTLGEVMYEINGNWYRHYDLVIPYEKKRMTQEVPKSTRLIDNLDIVEVRGNEVEIVLDYCDSVSVEEGIIRIIRTSKYPKTYEECCKILMSKTDFQDYSLVLTKLSTNKNEENSISPEPPHITLINNFYKLLICRDAYWKIAGEQMGLGKPWEPDWDSLDEKYDIYNYRGVIKYDSFTVRDRCLLGFPTQEKRDTFFENFKDLIEECKELL